MRIPIALVGSAASLFASPLAAQDVDAAERERQILECAKTVSDAARLACFDAVFTSNEGVREEIREAQQAEARENFGFSESERREREAEAALAAPSARQRIEPPEIEIVATVMDARNGPFDRFTILLDNGQIWQSTNAGNIRHTFKRGDRVTVREGDFTGYRLRVEGKTGIIGVERVR
jgi:hypothetical protein